MSDTTLNQDQRDNLAALQNALRVWDTLNRGAKVLGDQLDSTLNLEQVLRETQAALQAQKDRRAEALQRLTATADSVDAKAAEVAKAKDVLQLVLTSDFAFAEFSDVWQKAEAARGKLLTRVSEFLDVKKAAEVVLGPEKAAQIVGQLAPEVAVPDVEPPAPWSYKPLATEATAALTDAIKRYEALGKALQAKSAEIRAFIAGSKN